MIKVLEITELFEELNQIVEANSTADILTLLDLHESINRLFVIITRDEKVVFHSSFSRIAFAQHKYDLSRRDIFHIHQVRRQAELYYRNGLELDLPQKKLQAIIFSGSKAIIEIHDQVLSIPLPESLEERKNNEYPKSKERSRIKKFIPSLRIMAIDVDKENELIKGNPHEYPEETISIRYNISDRNENFTDALLRYVEIGSFPIVMQLEDVEVDEQGEYRPLAFVMEPDYLIDVTTVAERSKDYEEESLLYLIKRFLPRPSSANLLLGNITNFFLDELMMNSTLQIEDLFDQVFQQNPLALTVMGDDEVRWIFQHSKLHFLNLKSAITQTFKQKNIEWQDCYLEPSFYSPEYGLQGRLDIFHENPNDQNRPTIVELKSGKIWRPNRHGLNHNHYVQTLLYDLMLSSSFGRDLKPLSYILYSSESQDQLKFAPHAKSTQYEALNTRNKIIALERSLQSINTAHKLFSKITTDNYSKVKGFVKRDIEAFEQFYKGLTRLERAYLLFYTRFISIEHAIAKIGIQKFKNINGQASLWADSYFKKDSEFNVLGYLIISENKTKQIDPVICLKRTDRTNRLANFRVGDIAILYPFLGPQESPIKNQVFKCTIVQLNQEDIVIRLRSKQFNLRIFEKFEFWNLEHDLIDSSYLGLYRNLSQFLQRPKRIKQLLFTLIPPDQPQEIGTLEPKGMTEEQARIFNKAIAAKDYFLIWGPPGTGKTSVMVRHLTEYYFKKEKANILLLAYTNRAVDEMCAAIEQIDVNIPYIRVGSRYATHEKYRKRLFNEHITKAKKRSDVKKVVADHNIFVATISSFATKEELMRLKQFDVVIVDEASQVIEPQIVGLISRFKKIILIGDHNQLPAVVQQDVEISHTEVKLLNDIGISNLRNSLFERLYKRCQENNWHWAYDLLSHQGRMHRDIMLFPNTRFYKNQLSLLPQHLSYYEKQIEPQENDYAGQDNLLSVLSSQRLVFIEVPVDDTNTNAKTNIYEAAKVVEVIQALNKLHPQSSSNATNRIGIITPYRAQISAIRQRLFECDLNPDQYSIDTVERYQGSARDIIILSLSQNSRRQLNGLSVLSDNGIDRKLNVALTRARQQLILIGNKAVLSSSEIYRDLIMWMEGEIEL